ncbi:MAG: DNA repair protein RecN [Deltaproteobacteria bacterium]|nr:MAG: DNA repair protein RecN [Deltaproteobacteria bacterium]
MDIAGDDIAGHHIPTGVFFSLLPQGLPGTQITPAGIKGYHGAAFSMFHNCIIQACVTLGLIMINLVKLRRPDFRSMAIFTNSASYDIRFSGGQKAQFPFLAVNGMLEELVIRNFAIIDDLQIRFGAGLTILSGETGAGKSIIIQAVNLLLGSRASARMIRTGAESAELEAIFRIGKTGSVAAAMAAQGYSEDDHLLIRRVISRSDRHQIFINGRLATVGILNTIVENLASISGQHAHQTLLKPDRHLDILDQYGGLNPLRTRVNDAYQGLTPMIDELNGLIAMRDGRSAHLELLAFQRDEILKSGVTPEEEEELDLEQRRLKNAEALHGAVHKSIDALYGMEGAAIERMADARRYLEKAAEIDPRLDDNARKATEAALAVEDLAETLRSYLSTVHTDDKRLEEVEARQDIIIRLKHKYGGTMAAVFDHLHAAEKELSRVENVSQAIDKLKEKIDRVHENLSRLCRTLSKKRSQAAKKLARAVEAQLASLRMEKTRFRVELAATPAVSDPASYLAVDGRQVTPAGIDQAVFMIAPNVGENLKPLARVASGGELSRVILALKAILAETDSVETVVFDEVDAGIGGGTAEVVGRKLVHLSESHQVICITHLPQIARFGHQHFRIEKTVVDGRTITLMNPLDRKKRVEEIARMLGGEKITRKTLEHAREMLESG